MKIHEDVVFDIPNGKPDKCACGCPIWVHELGYEGLCDRCTKAAKERDSHRS